MNKAAENVKSQFGVIGLGVMGRNLVLNMERNGISVGVYGRSQEKVDEFVKTYATGKKIVGTADIAAFVAGLETPRRILLMVTAGAAVDESIDALLPHLSPGDIIIDGGNSLYTDTQRREDRLRKINTGAGAGGGIKFFGMGVSGGEEGALWGPSLMPGGDREAYNHLEPILTKIAAKTPDDGACVAYIGTGGAGHYVKMTHNGIEYGDMQLIAEAYDLLKNVGGLDNKAIKNIFEEWNKGELESFLIDVTAKVMDYPDPQAPTRPLLEQIRDVVGMKGTGTWTVKAALETLVPIPTINAAVEAREMSMLKPERTAASKSLNGPTLQRLTGDIAVFVEEVRAALYCSKVCSYAQGFAMLKAGNSLYGYGLNLPEIARIWKAGCIIRAAFLDDIKRALIEEPQLPNLLVTKFFREKISQKQAAWRRVVGLAVQNGIATPAFGASLAYYDAYRRDRLPGNLIQAQRDYFGAHTYERLETPGKAEHAQWGNPKA